MNGIVIKCSGSEYVVRPAGQCGESDVVCRIKGNFRIKGIRSTNPIAVGDRVVFGAPGLDGVALISAIEKRRNYLIRKPSNLSKQSHIIAANVDTVAVMMSLVHPTTSTTFVDRVLVTATAYSVPALIIINKVDLLSAEDLDLLDAFQYLYSTIGYPVYPICAHDPDSLSSLRAVLAGKTTLIVGNSGVGKTTLINALIPALNLKTAEISAVHDTGMHTTTFSEMFSLPEGGYLIDTPGVRGFGTIEMNRHEVSHYFPEMFQLAPHCRFADCTHTHEPGCAVIDALNEKRIAQSRYASYLSILEEINEGKYR